MINCSLIANREAKSDHTAEQEEMKEGTNLRLTDIMLNYSWAMFECIFNCSSDGCWGPSCICVGTRALIYCTDWVLPTYSHICCLDFHIPPPPQWRMNFMSLGMIVHIEAPFHIKKNS